MLAATWMSRDRTGSKRTSYHLREKPGGGNLSDGAVVNEVIRTTRIGPTGIMTATVARRPTTDLYETSDAV